jgi:hypothetical protein
MEESQFWETGFRSAFRAWACGRVGGIYNQRKLVCVVYPAAISAWMTYGIVLG